MKNEKDVINVYWAPCPNSLVLSDFMYPDPKTLFSELTEKKIKDGLDPRSFFSCPAVKNKFKNTLVFKNIIDSEYEYHEDSNKKNIFNPISKNYLDFNLDRKPALTTGPQLMLGLSYIFFADEDLEAHFSSPTFHKPGYTNYGSIFPGNFNIGSWFRPYNFEVQLWEKSGKFIIKEDEPIFYVNFQTDKKIKLHRFVLNEKLVDYSKQCVHSSFTIKPNLSLLKRYEMFKNSRLNDQILQEIKKSVVGGNGE